MTAHTEASTMTLRWRQCCCKVIMIMIIIIILIIITYNVFNCITMRSNSACTVALSAWQSVLLNRRIIIIRILKKVLTLMFWHKINVIGIYMTNRFTIASTTCLTTCISRCAPNKDNCIKYFCENYKLLIAKTSSKTSRTITALNLTGLIQETIRSTTKINKKISKINLNTFL